MGPVCTKQENAPNSKFELFCCEMQLSARRGGTLKILSKFSACHFVKQRGGRGPSPKSFPAQDSSAKAAALYFERGTPRKEEGKSCWKVGRKISGKGERRSKSERRSKEEMGGNLVKASILIHPCSFFLIFPSPMPLLPPMQGRGIAKGGRSTP